MTNSLLAAAHFTLTHRETGRVLLHDLCFSLMPGERLTVIGPSGQWRNTDLSGDPGAAFIADFCRERRAEFWWV